MLIAPLAASTLESRRLSHSNGHGCENTVLEPASTGAPPAGSWSRPVSSHDKQVVHALKQAGVAPERKPAIHGGARRQITGKQPPSDPAPQHVEDRVDDLPQRPASEQM